jgi:hypothetical protein
MLLFRCKSNRQEVYNHLEFGGNLLVRYYALQPILSDQIVYSVFALDPYESPSDNVPSFYPTSSPRDVPSAMVPSSDPNSPPSNVPTNSVLPSSDPSSPQSRIPSSIPSAAAFSLEPSLRKLPDTLIITTVY